MRILDPHERKRVLDEAATWRGTPWHHNARIKGVGVDCAQYLAAVYHASGIIEEVAPREYAADWALHRNQELFAAEVLRHAVPVDEPGPADVVLYKVGRTFSHGAIVVQWPNIIHACRERGMVCYDEGDSGLFNDRRARFYSVRIA